MGTVTPPITTVDGQQHRKKLDQILFRSTRPGPESDLVHRFLVRLKPRISTFEDCHVTIFKEPKLDGCYPDLVFVAWRSSVTRKWRQEREGLQAHDLRILQHLVSTGRQRTDDLVTLFGNPARTRLCKLYEAGLLSRRGQVWQAKSLSSTFAAVAIVAIEAKIHNWAAAIQQAFLNTWFASRSYVLVPEAHAAARLKSSASARGVGVLSADSRLAFRRARIRPRSYVSWQLNEWAWRASLKAR